MLCSSSPTDPFRYVTSPSPALPRVDQQTNEERPAGGAATEEEKTSTFVGQMASEERDTPQRGFH